MQTTHDNRIDMTSHGSNGFSRYDELAMQKKHLEAEELELTK